MVSNQEHALQFYTTVLGFTKKTDIPMGEHRWLTVVSKEEPDAAELVLEPVAFPPAKVLQQALFDAGIPLTAFQVDNVEKEFDRLNASGVAFSMKPALMGTSKIAVLNDTCGNNIQLYEIV